MKALNNAKSTNVSFSQGKTLNERSGVWRCENDRWNLERLSHDFYEEVDPKIKAKDVKKKTRLKVEEMKN